MTAAELVEQALREIDPAPTPEAALHWRSTLQTQVQSALRRLSELVVSGGLLRKTVTVTAVNGEANLVTPLTDAEPLLLDHLRRASIFIDGFTSAAQWKADRSSLTYASTTQFPYYTLENQTVIIRDATGLDHYDGPVLIRNAPYVPTLANVPVTLQPLLVEILVNHARPQKPAEMATTHTR